MHKNYFLEVIGEKPALFSAMLRFNGITPADDAQTLPDRLAELFADLPRACLEALWRYKPSRKRLLAFAPGPDDPFWDFSEESRCLALLEPGTLDELAAFYGATLHAHEITRTILGKDIAELRETLGERAHAYALQRGQYRAPAGREEFSTRHREMPLGKRALLHGWEALGIIASGWPQTLQNRVRVVPPADMPVSAALQNGIWFDVKKILIMEVAPAWAPCFA
ncbi:MAG: hypothetical protein LBU06_03245 [Desulfovibrio sp.]|jgi:hypothetical protein|nr:hypothetical protein [Desulfovibrio sp.]